jgi:hypothetical protein
MGTPEGNMSARNLDECKRILEQIDRDTIDRRAERCHELEVAILSAQKFSSQREWDYAREASASYINGNYRSAILCCACSVDQVFRYEYLRVPGNKYKDLWQSNRQLTFGQLIRKCKERKVTRLTPFLEKAELLNRIRNDVAAHPVFTDVPCASDTERELQDELMRRDITALLNLVGELDSERKRDIEDTELINNVEGWQCTFGKAICQESGLPTASLMLFWALIQEDILRFLANRAWHIKREILEGLYGAE